MIAWPFILGLVMVVLIALPLLPAVIELLFPRDNKPLRVVQEHDGDVKHFAKGFDHYVRTRMYKASKEPIYQNIIYDSPALKIDSQHDKITSSEHNIPQTIVSNFPLVLPAHKFFEAEIFSSRPIEANHHSSFRAILSKEDVLLGEHCKVLRWIHCDGSLYAKGSCKLYGRASANHNICLAAECEFERLEAPKVEFGEYDRLFEKPIASEIEYTRIIKPLKFYRQFKRRWLIKGTFDFPKESIFDGDVIAKKNVFVGARARIDGSVKSNKRFVLGDSSIIDGAAISVGPMHIGKGCMLKGPVISEESIHISAGTIIGSSTQPATVTAPIITIEPGVIIHGTIWATVKGSVLSQTISKNTRSEDI